MVGIGKLVILASPRNKRVVQLVDPLDRGPLAGLAVKLGLGAAQGLVERAWLSIL